MAARQLRVAIASGKGGTGKTLVSLNLANMFGANVQLADCDVEEPNLNLFLRYQQQEQHPVTMLIPEVDEKLCNGCGKCSAFCRFNGIISLGTKAMVFPELCHGCGGCALVCPQKAITEKTSQIGTVSVSRNKNITLVEGRLQVGISLVPPIISAVQEHLQDDLPAILDAPPGTSCPVVAALQGADYALLVTDPTPFGLHDLKLAVALVKELAMPCGVVVNRAGNDQVGLYDYCKDQNLPVLLEIPDDRRIAEITSRGELISQVLPEYTVMFSKLAQALKEVGRQTGGGN